MYARGDGGDGVGVTAVGSVGEERSAGIIRLG